MGIFKKVKGAVNSKANAAIDKLSDPAKELDLVLMDLETQRGIAIKELLSYKASAKAMDRDLDEQATRAAAWEKRAMIAIKNGDDSLAKECLQRKRNCEIERGKIKRDQNEAAGYALQLNNSRKVLDTKLKMLKLRKGTMAARLASARSGGSDPFTESNDLFDKLDEAERRIDEEIFEQEAARELDSEEEGNAALEAALLKAAEAPVVVGVEAEDSEGDPLAALKAKMAGDAKLLKD
jgi:phage shock protein A